MGRNGSSNTRPLKKRINEGDQEDILVETLIKGGLDQVQMRILKFINARGQNLFECAQSGTDCLNTVLVEMPPKYRNALWIKRGMLISLTY